MRSLLIDVILYPVVSLATGALRYAGRVRIGGGEVLVHHVRSSTVFEALQDRSVVVATRSLFGLLV